MFRKTILFAMLIMITFSLKLQGQTTYSSGNLVRVGFSQKEASPKDTLGSWYETIKDGYYNIIYSQYFEHITTPGGIYFLKKYEKWFESPSMTYYDGNRAIEKEGSKDQRPLGINAGPGWDVMSPYMIDRTIVQETKNGVWLISGDFNNAFLSSNDSLIKFNRYDDSKQKTMADYMFAILGKVGSLYLASFAGQPYTYNYYLVDLTDSPDLDSSKAIKVIIDNIDYNNHFYPNAVTRVRNITGDLYAVSKWRSSGLDIYRLKETAFNYIKTTLEGDSYQSSFYFTPWEFRNGRLYRINYNTLESYDFNPSDTTFINRKVLVDSLISGNSLFYGIDRNLRYAAKLIKDTLKIFDVDKARFINSIYTGGLKDLLKPVIDSPYVYIHQIRDQYTGVEENKESVVKSYSLSAYPNPFNSSVKIVYSLPEDSRAELIVYDLLGRKAAVLVNEEVKKGSHEVLFNASHLPSGIYFYTLKAGSFTKTNKIILMK